MNTLSGIPHLNFRTILPGWMEMGLLLTLFCLLPETGVAAEEQVVGEIEFPEEWTVFAPLEQADPQVTPDMLRSMPTELNIGGKTLPAKKIKHTNNQFDFKPFLGEPTVAMNRVAYVFVPLNAESERDVTFGMGADNRMQVWLNGAMILDTTGKGNKSWPPSIKDYLVKAHLKTGQNVIAIRFISGKASSVLALGGPLELRAGDFWTIIPDQDSDTAEAPQCQPAVPGGKPQVDIGSRLELFIDDYLIDGMSGGAERRLQHPIPREVVLTLDQPWEGKASAYFSVVKDGKRIRIYYNGRPEYPKGGSQTTCVAESEDGIHFSRPKLGLIDFKGSKENNMVWRLGPSGHNFTPFLDPNPAAPPDQRYKAVAYHPKGGGLAAYASPDGINWRTLSDEYIIGPPGPDSQNLAFWDADKKRYFMYYRRADTDPKRSKLRSIWKAESEDFIHWAALQPLQYEDERMEHMYINTIRPYFRAPHIYVGTPARFVPRRKKIAEHPENGISDTVLMCSRDGLLFNRWEEAFLRPGPEPEVWTDRNNYFAWGMVQTTPEEISMYWTEHYRHPGMRLRRGTIRTDGFVSVHAGGKQGEMLTRPFIFSGNKLIINYATSAVGSLLFELCDPSGRPIKGFSLADSEVLFGNEIEHAVNWKRKSDIGSLAGQPVRLRVRLYDADMYSIRFTP